jgi:hypothetical protein
MIQSMTAGESAPAARIAALSITTPPEACGRDNLVTSALISTSSTTHTVAVADGSREKSACLRRVRVRSDTGKCPLDTLNHH